jgi:hypothetical protein
MTSTGALDRVIETILVDSYTRMRRTRRSRPFQRPDWTWPGD